MHSITDERTLYTRSLSDYKSMSYELGDDGDISNLDLNDTCEPEESPANSDVVADTAGQFASQSELFAGPHAEEVDAAQPGEVEPEVPEDLQAPLTPVDLLKLSAVQDVVPDTSGVCISETDLFYEPACEVYEGPQEPFTAMVNTPVDHPCVPCVLGDVDGKPWYLGTSTGAENVRRDLQDSDNLAVLLEQQAAQPAKPSAPPQERACRPRRTRPNKGLFNREIVVDKRISFVFGYRLPAF
jgi:hypothetical protein